MKDGDVISIEEFLRSVPVIGGDGEVPRPRRGRPKGSGKRAEERAPPQLSEAEEAMFEAYQNAVSADGALTVRGWAELIKAAGFALRYNVVLDRHEVNGEPANESTYPEIMSALRVFGEKADVPLLDRRDLASDAIKFAFEQNLWHPVKEWFVGLGTHDFGGYYSELAEADIEAIPEAERPFNRLMSYIKDEHGLAATWLRRWMLGCLGRLSPEGFQNYTLVLKGPQGIGKSFFLRWLCSVGREYFQEGILVPDDKDHKIRLGSRWIWAVDEFGGGSGQVAQSRLKAFLTQETVTERAPYAKFAKTVPRLCNIATTTNDATFLDDPTGSRRYLVLDLTDIDQAYSRDIKPDDVWADIAHQYLLERARGDLTGEEKAKQLLTNTEVEEEDAVTDWLRSVIVKNPEGRILQSELYERAFARFATNREPWRENRLRKEIRQLLTRFGKIKRGKSNGVRFYFGASLRPYDPALE